MKQHICILWDASYIWGLMAWRAAVAMGLPCRLVKSKEIAQGALSGKPPALLLAPGGTARLKAAALGAKGRDALRRYVADGGKYLGFCGGAGLGLSGGEGLGLCPWSRAAYTDRMQHMVSGHVLSQPGQHPLCPPPQAFPQTLSQPLPPAEPATSPHGLSQPQPSAPPQENSPPLLSLPVWWPGRFAPQENTHAAPENAVQVLAAYARPDADLCLTDIPLASLPQDIFGTWQALYGVNMGVDFLTGQPCVIAGSHGEGSYVLSYSHLETPDSPQANAWLAHMLRTLAGLAPERTHLPPWEVDSLPPLWPRTEESAPLFAAREGVMRLMDLGARHNLLFRRTPWLRGWRSGIPGAALNNLHTALCTALALEPTDAALAFWREKRDTVRRALPLFLQGVEGYLLAERLATTLSASLPDAVDRRGLKAQREALFGQPMQGGGLYQELLDVADELVFLLART